MLVGNYVYTHKIYMYTYMVYIHIHSQAVRRDCLTGTSLIPKSHHNLRRILCIFYTRLRPMSELVYDTEESIAPGDYLFQF